MEQQTERKERKNRFDEQMMNSPVDRLLLGTGVPIILAMLLQAVYNLVDGAFVSNMAENGELALNALILAFPILMLIVAVSVGTGVGVNVLLSRSFGQDDSEKMGRVAGNALLLGVVIYVVFLLFGLFGVRPYMALQTSNPVVLEMGTEYLTICCAFSFGMIFFVLFEKLLQATGRTGYATIARVIGLVVNIVLDPILIYGLGGHPGLGMRGAAIASVIGQSVSAVLGLAFCLKMNTELKLSAHAVKPDTEVIRGIYSVGWRVVVWQAMIAVTALAMNLILVRISEAAVIAYGLYYRIYQILMFAAFGMRDAIRPILAYHSGKEDRGRMNDVIHFGMRDTLIIMVVGLIAVEILARPIAAVFGLSGSTQELAVVAIRVISLGWLFAGANIAYHGVFQAFTARRQAFLLPVFRQLLFVLPLALVFSLIAGQDTSKLWIVWLAYPITEFVTMLFAVGFMKKLRWEKIDILDPEAMRKEQEARKEQSLQGLEMPSNWF